MSTFQLQQTDRRHNISTSDLSTSWIHRGGKDKLHGGYKTRVICPECEHHAFEYSPLSGHFICWYCHIWGKLADKDFNKEQELPDIKPQPNHSTRNMNRNRQKSSSSPLPANSISSHICISDYMPLDANDLEDIEEISLQETVVGNQKLVRDYLTEIGLTPQFAAEHHLAFATRYVKLKDEDQGKMRLCIAFRNYVDGYLCNVKFRSISIVATIKTKPDGTKITRSHREKGFDQISSFTPCAPYNINCIRTEDSANADMTEAISSRSTLIITEGEKDCLTLLALGYKNVISVASGANTDHRKSFQAFEQWLDGIGTIVICSDQDLKGRQMAEQLCEYFDSKLVKVVGWDQREGGKDITELRLNRGEEHVHNVIAAARTVMRNDILTFSTADQRNQVMQNARGYFDRGYDIGLGPLTNKVFRLSNQGGLVIVTGVPNAGKTDFLNYMTTSLMAHRNKSVCYCSFETPDKFRHAGELTQIWVGETPCEMLDDEILSPYVEAVTERLVHLSLRREKPTPERVLQKAEAAMRQKPDIEYLVIDPYLYLSMTTGRNITETEAIKAMLTEIQDWSHDHHVWTFLVAHPRKLQTEDGTNDYEEVNMYTISGSANWANVADFIFSLKRVEKPSRNIDYTKMSVLKVRDQKLCRKGDVYFQRQECGRYDERASEEECISNKGKQDKKPWSLVELKVNS